MPMKVSENGNLESLIGEIKELLNGIIIEQEKMQKNMEKHHSITMKKLDQLREFDQILDMTNQIFERRIANIEQAIIQKQK